MSYRVEIDEAACAAHGDCEQVAPEVFWVEDIAVVIGTVPADRLMDAVDAFDLERKVKFETNRSIPARNPLFRLFFGGKPSRRARGRAAHIARASPPDRGWEFLGYHGTLWSSNGTRARRRPAHADQD